MAPALPYLAMAGLFVALAVLETARPLRASVEPRPRRVARNLGIAGLGLAALTLLQAPLLVPVAEWARGHRIGILNWTSLPAAVETVAALLLLDYTLWIWHWMNHRVPFLWRFHLVHHVDLDLDSSTAFRFHFGELLLSIGYRALQIAVIGAGVTSLWIWQTILFVAILFHHSNIRLPAALDA